ncbi:MAG TPA: aminotransferase class IV [Acidimicrobiales bacterium]|nr:aminotransferase class IV [Acidimicrobiales bacterium]
MKVHVNGALVAEEDAVIPVTDHGLTVGDGLFETMKVVDGVAFAVGRHLARLRRTAAGLGLDVPSDDALRDAIATTIATNDPGVGRVRLTITGGSGPPGTLRGAGRSTVLVVCSARADVAPAAAVVSVPWPRNERGALSGLKTTSYAENVIALAHAHEHGADEAIFANTAGNLCEGTGTNVFVVIGDRLVTPPLAAGCLAGVTRELLLEVAYGLVEIDVPMDAFATADEAFLTSSTRDVQSIASIDGRALATVAGPLTVAARESLLALQSRTFDP